MKERCLNCRHWGADGASTYEYYDAEKDDAVSTDHRICGRIRLAQYYAEKTPPEPAFTRDASGYCAQLWSAPEFGCSLFEGKEK